MASQYYERKLFGGHIECEIPKDFEDVNTYRQIPDHQEVFASDSNDQSIVIEIFEKAPVSDEEAAKFHFQELAESNEAATSEIISNEPIPDENVPELPTTAVCSMVTGKQIVSKFKESTAEAANYVLMYVAVIRLHEFHTDIVISMNHPVVISAQSTSSQSMTAETDPKVSLTTFKHLLETFKIEDFKLFGEPY
ncbi:hypothetical protein IWQ60_003534 [Tieghemiomyces parasiticus]|uniref:Ran guanine nucleotide release factor n=1 Tax=Tieghemiomyces parasiticus TaxID=78921 RepID=A0A9W8DZZ8_9FUNG|nr:hypothetical protein IWQ60_003534 [Tieghemiomyces parasiticus]